MSTRKTTPKRQEPKTAKNKKKKTTRAPASRGKALVIVESPAKARTIKKFLGSRYEVKASVGHIRDLPKQKLGVDVDHGFEPEYTKIQGKMAVIRELKAAARGSDSVYLGPDPDREGEAIAWHIAQELNGNSDKIYRVLFNEITERGVQQAMQNPGRIDQEKVNAQQARRILDRLVGYMVSPLLWRNVSRGLSAGRVQSVALRLICEREREIKAFVAREYWTVEVQLQGGNPPPFQARLHSKNGEKLDIPGEAEARAIVEELQRHVVTVREIQQRERRRNPVPPFTTSTLQQEAARRLRFSAKKTMAVAQRLYEGVDVGQEGPVGLITYMRTDSVRLAAEAQAEARDYVGRNIGAEYLPDAPPQYRSKKGAQEAHEAIRPTSVWRRPEDLAAFLDKDDLDLYRLIWNRYLASQMAPAVLDMTTVIMDAGPYELRATGSVVKFAGFMQLYVEGKDEDIQVPAAGDEDEGEGVRFPVLQQGERLDFLGVTPSQHFTQPPPRYTEASLVKELEQKAIGRPSTYASIMSTIRNRLYVVAENRKFVPTQLGFLVNDLLVEHFPDIFDVEFTAHMEENLDEIAEGERNWKETLSEFYAPFRMDLNRAEEKLAQLKREGEQTSETCDRCGKPMVIRMGRYGRFLACSGYPECRKTRPLAGDKTEPEEVVQTDEVCEQCGAPMVIKKGRFGRFLACSRYPECKATKPLSTGVSCPQPDCDGTIVERRSKRGRVFFSCSNYPKCDYALWDRPVPEPCPQCSHPFLVEKVQRTGEILNRCPRKGCGYRKELAEQPV